jgi:ubiquitin-conjugating enzyme E2 D/E
VFTSLTLESMINGTDVAIALTANLQQVVQAVFPILSRIGSMPPNANLFVYLSGGVVFSSGTLNDYFTGGGFPGLKRHLYVIVFEAITPAILDAQYTELCNANGEDRKKLLSPVVRSTDIGDCQIACLLGYLNHNGMKRNKFTNTLAQLTGFAPLITSLHQICRKDPVRGVDIVTVTASLHAFVRGFVACPPACTFDYLLRVASFAMASVDVDDVQLPLRVITVDASANDATHKYLASHSQPATVCMWQPDSGTDFVRYVLERPQNPRVIEDAFSQFTALRPSAPLSLRTATGATIFWAGKGRTSLYLSQTQTKDGSSSKVDVIKPLVGTSKSKDVKKLAQALDDEDEGLTDLVDPATVQQLIQVCFDESGSMGGNLDGFQCNPGDIHRVTIAAQYLTNFANRQYAYRIPCIQGLLSFGTRINVRSKMSPLVPYFEDGVKKVVPNGGTPLWDCLSKARESLVAANQGAVRGNAKYPNATLRILVISDGEDTASNEKPEAVASALVRDGIVVDAVIINSKDTCKMLCALCHVTGGLAFRPQTVVEGLALFEQEAFLFTSKRRQPGRYQGTITAQTMEVLEGQAVFDTVVQNLDVDVGRAQAGLQTARQVVFQARAAPPRESRAQRMIREIRMAAAVQDRAVRAVDGTGNAVDVFDDSIKIYPSQADTNQWRVFLQGPVDTPYAQKWWYLLVTFPPDYPEMPPLFRFVSVPFHLNVSAEGRVCLSVIERGYVASANTVELIQIVKGMFIEPDDTTPVQLTKAALYKDSRQEYLNLARQSTAREARNNPRDFFTGDPSDQVPADFQLEQMTIVPQWERSPFTGDPIPKDKQIRASSGVLYNRDELKQYILSTQNPICQVTGKRLTETAADFP